MVRPHPLRRCRFRRRKHFMHHDRTLEFRECVIRNQQSLSSNLRENYDFIVCGTGRSGSVVAARLAADPNIHILVLEAGSTDDSDLIMNPQLAQNEPLHRQSRHAHRSEVTPTVESCRREYPDNLRRGFSVAQRRYGKTALKYINEEH
jgi:hypothetical protein